jgi:hypothetical protein
MTMPNHDPAPRATTFRRAKTDPCTDFWHTLKVGAPVAVILAVALPFLFRLFAS